MLTLHFHIGNPILTTSLIVHILSAKEEPLASIIIVKNVVTNQPKAMMINTLIQSDLLLSIGVILR